MGIKVALMLAASSTMLGCGNNHPPPEGYVESCYGGDYKKYINGIGPRLYIRIPMTEAQWLDLTESMRQFGVQQKLDFFDTTMRDKYAHVLELSACSAKGIQIYARDDVWKSHPEADGDPGFTTVFLYSFKDFDVSAIGEALVVHLESRHPGATVTRADDSHR